MRSADNRVEGRSRSSDRSSKWKIGLKIETSKRLRGAREGWTEGEEEEEEEVGFLRSFAREGGRERILRSSGSENRR